MEQLELDNIFVYHPPVRDQAERYCAIRAEARKFASLVNLLCPDSREKSLALTKIQEATMWANAAIAIREADADETIAAIDRESEQGARPLVPPEPLPGSSD